MSESFCSNFDKIISSNFPPVAMEAVSISPFTNFCCSFSAIHFRNVFYPAVCDVDFLFASQNRCIERVASFFFEDFEGAVK